MANLLTVIGLMSGTSLDGVDAAVIRTDGEAVVEPGAAVSIPYDRPQRVFIQRAIKAAIEGRDASQDIDSASTALTKAHVDAVQRVMEEAGLAAADVDYLGFHGQTILHRPARDPASVGFTWQIGEPDMLAEQTGIDVIYDFRSADVEEGGEGAPLAPVYHAARVRTLGRPHPVAVLNLGGVSNVTYVPPGGDDRKLLAFDCGPANGLLDEWMELKTGETMDKNAALARTGRSHDEVLRMMLRHPFLHRTPPKSLDRYDFKLDPVLALSPADGAATLTAFSAVCVARAAEHLPERPGEWIVCGGGRHNPLLMEALGAALSAPVRAAEEVDWRGDFIEAECFGYLAARVAAGLPTSFPLTTGVRTPTCGGQTLHAFGSAIGVRPPQV